MLITGDVYLCGTVQGVRDYNPNMDIYCYRFLNSRDDGEMVYRCDAAFDRYEVFCIYKETDLALCCLVYV